jgi:predicted acylesterase/phospholipase RssA
VGNDLLAAALGAQIAGSAAAGLAQVSHATAYALDRDSTTLVLPGGAAPGAYAAGVIEGLRQRAGIPNGVALPGVNLVAGTSIGAINGWFVATGQYTLLKHLWDTIASQHIFRMKKRYAATVKPGSHVFTRILHAAQMSQGLMSNVTGLLDGAPIHDWLARNIDPSVPLVMAYLFTLTNLDERRAEVFYRVEVHPTPEARAAAAARLRAGFSTPVATREIEDIHLAPALAASSAIPILLDPITIAFADGPKTYIDGGVADSAPLDVARTLSNRVQVIFVDPARAKPRRFPTAAAVGTVAFGIAQSRMFEASLRVAYLETRGNRLFRRDATTPEQRAFLEQTFDVDIFVIRPEQELPVESGDFDDADGIEKTYGLGRQAGLAGFREYDPGVGAAG